MDVSPSEPAKFEVASTDSFLEGNRLRRPASLAAAAASPGLDSEIWSALPADLLLLIFARLPVNAILRIRSLNSAWKSTVTSPRFQAAFEEASCVRVALLVKDKVAGTMFLTRSNEQECFRPHILPWFREVGSSTPCAVVATLNGLVCVLEYEAISRTPRVVALRVSVVNVVTGVRRALPRSSIMPTPPLLVRMETTTREVDDGGYTITFLYVMLNGMITWEVYSSAGNQWIVNDESRLAQWSVTEIFNMFCSSTPTSFYEIVAILNTKVRAVSVFDPYASHGECGDGDYIAHSVHNVSGDMYRLDVQVGRHGVWKIPFGAKTWELVCEFPKAEGTWTCLRVMNEVVVLVFKVPYESTPDARLVGVLGIDVGTVLKVFHMPTKTWHSFPGKEAVVQNWGLSIRKDFAGPFLAELKFDAVP